MAIWSLVMNVPAFLAGLYFAVSFALLGRDALGGTLEDTADAKALGYSFENLRTWAISGSLMSLTAILHDWKGETWTALLEYICFEVTWFSIFRHVWARTRFYTAKWETSEGSTCARCDPWWVLPGRISCELWVLGYAFVTVAFILAVPSSDEEGTFTFSTVLWSLCVVIYVLSLVRNFLSYLPMLLMRHEIKILYVEFTLFTLLLHIAASTSLRPMTDWVLFTVLLVHTVISIWLVILDGCLAVGDYWMKAQVIFVVCAFLMSLVSSYLLVYQPDVFPVAALLNMVLIASTYYVCQCMKNGYHARPSMQSNPTYAEISPNDVHDVDATFEKELAVVVPPPDAVTLMSLRASDDSSSVSSAAPAQASGPTEPISTSSMACSSVSAL